MQSQLDRQYLELGRHAKVELTYLGGVAMNDGNAAALLVRRGAAGSMNNTVVWRRYVQLDRVRGVRRNPGFREYWHVET